MIYNNSRNISMINNLSAIDSKGEEKENKNEVIISKELLKEEKDKEKENVNINERKISEEKNEEIRKEEEKDNKLRKQFSNRFLPPKKLEDFFTEGDFKSEEMSFNDFTEKETNKGNNDNNSNINNNIEREEEKNELNRKTEEKKSIKENNKENKIINNFNINININKEDKKSETNVKENINKNSVNKNINNVNKKEDIVYEYEYGIIESNKRNRYKKLEGNIDNQKIDKEKDIKCDCIIV